MKLALFGYGGHAREVYWSLDLSQRVGLKFFVDDKYYKEEDENVFPTSKFDPEEYKVMVAVGDPKIRKSIVDSLPSNTKYFTFIHPTAQIIGADVTIGEGSFIGINSIITTNIVIGKHAILNRGNQIGHDSIIGDFFSAMPGAIVSGNVHIGNCVYMGTNSSIIEKKFISNDITIGANGVVTRDITESGVYVGVPAKKTQTN